VRGGTGGKGSGRGGTGAKEAAGSVPDNPRSYRASASGTGPAVPTASDLGGVTDFVGVWGNPLQHGGSSALVGGMPIGNHQTGAANRLNAISDIFGFNTRIRQVGINKQSANLSALNRWRFGFYSDAGTYPGALLYDSGDMLIADVGSIAGQFTRVSPNLTLRKGVRYWLSWIYSAEVITNVVNVIGMRSDSIYGAVGWRNHNWIGANGVQLLQGTAIGNVGTQIIGWQQDQAYGPMPLVWPGSPATAPPLRHAGAVDLPAHIIGVDYP
jgi:hypothetical protein